MGFLMNFLAVMNIRQATRVELTLFGCFSCSGTFLIGKKPRSSRYEWLDIVIALKFMELRVNWDENRMKVILGLMNWGFI